MPRYIVVDEQWTLGEIFVAGIVWLTIITLLVAAAVYVAIALAALAAYVAILKLMPRTVIALSLYGGVAWLLRVHPIALIVWSVLSLMVAIAWVRAWSRPNERKPAGHS